MLVLHCLSRQEHMELVCVGMELCWEQTAGIQCPRFLAVTHFAEVFAGAGPAQSARRLLLLFPLKNGTEMVPISLHSSQGCNLSGLLFNGLLSCGSCGFALEIVMAGVVELKFMGLFKVACSFWRTAWAKSCWKNDKERARKSQEERSCFVLCSRGTGLLSEALQGVESKKE